MTKDRIFAALLALIVLGAIAECIRSGACEGLCL